MDLPLTDEELQKIDEATERDRELFRSIVVAHSVSSCEVDASLPMRKRTAEKHSDRMNHGRMSMQERKPKRGRNY